MEPHLQRRVQRYGWDRAAIVYERLWQEQLARVQAELLAAAAPRPGEQVLDVACGTGLVAFAAARAVGSGGAGGAVLGVDLSGAMVEAARQRALSSGQANAGFARMDAEDLALPDASFDVVLCALGLMYLPDPAQALREMRRVLRPGGRLGLAVWGDRSRCGWAAVFEIVDAEVASEVCPLFFHLGRHDALARLCGDAGFTPGAQRRITMTLDYPGADAACDAALVGGPVAMAWSRFDAPTRARVREKYLHAIEPWRFGGVYRIPAEFVVATAQVPVEP